MNVGTLGAIVLTAAHGGARPQEVPHHGTGHRHEPEGGTGCP